MAAELCKVSLWMEALEPGKPLSFLEHRIQCGNSLLGTTPALLKQGLPDEVFNPIEGDDKKVCQEYKKRNKGERRGFQSLFNPTGDAWDSGEALPVCFLRLDEIEDDDLKGIHQKEESYDACLHSQSYQNGRLVADAWSAAFVWKKTRQFPYAITQEVFQRLQDYPAAVPEWMQAEISRLAQEYQFFHWHLAFPDVFRVTDSGNRDGNEQSGWNGGFDVVLANPPWERVKLQEKEWFASRMPEIANAPNAANRKRLIDNLAHNDPALHGAFLADRRRAEGESHFIRSSGCYPLCGRGDVNTYTVFAETMRLIIRPAGKVGCIVPSGIATDDTTKFFFRDIMDKKSLLSLYDFKNREGIFEGVHRSYKFCLLTLTGGGDPAQAGAEFVFFAHKVEDLRDEERRFTLSAEDIALLNPNTRTCPIFRSKRDAELCKGIYRRVPILIKDGPPEENPWGIKFMTMFHMSNDSHLFRTREELESHGWRLEGNVFRKGDEKYLPL